MWSLFLCVSALISITVCTELSIECGGELTGTLQNSSNSLSIRFVLDEEEMVTFTNCDSDFDTTLYLYDSAGSFIQNQSTNNCGGDDCGYCSDDNRESFTMDPLGAGEYSLVLSAYNDGGEYSLTVHCGEEEEDDEEEEEDDEEEEDEEEEDEEEEDEEEEEVECDSEDSDCEKYIELLNVYDNRLDGVWLWDADDCSYHPTNSALEGYTLRFDDESWHTMGSVFCYERDITKCSGQWRTWDPEWEAEVVDPDGSSLHSDCYPEDDCDLSGTEHDMNCIHSMLYSLH